MWNRQLSTNIHLDHSSPTGNNGLHCIEFLHEMRKIMLKLVPSDPFSLVQESVGFDNLIHLYLLLASVLDLCFHDLIICILFDVA